MNRTQAMDFIVSILSDIYRGKATENTYPVLLSKDGSYTVAQSWDDADYGMKRGWNYEPLTREEAQEIGNKARELTR